MAILLVGLVSLLFRGLLLLLFPFDGLYGQDAFFYLTATQDLVKVWTDPGKLWQWLTVWGTPPISVWPLGYHIQMALVSPITGLNTIAGQAINFVAGTLTPMLTSMLMIATWQCIGSRVRDEGIGTTPSSLTLPRNVLYGSVLAGLIMAVSPLAVRASLVVMADMAGLFWAVLGALLAVRYLSAGNRVRDEGIVTTPSPYSRTLWTGLAGGLCLGIASITRYIYPLLLLPIFLFIIGSRDQGSGVRDREAKATNRSLIPDPWSLLVRRFWPLAAPLVFLVGLQLLHNLAHPMGSLPSPVISTWNPAHAWQSSFDSPDGHLSYKWPMGYFFLLRPLLSLGALGLGLLPMLMLGLLALVRWKALAAAGLLVGWWLLFTGFYSGNIYQADRFVLSYLPPMAIVAGLGGFWILDFGFWTKLTNSKIQNPKSKIVYRLHTIAILLVLCAAGVGLLISAVTAWADFRGLYTEKEDYLRAARCVQETVGSSSPQKPLFSFGITFTLRQYTRLNPRELFLETPGSVDQALEGGESDVRGYLALPLSGFEEQWGNTRIGETYHHLKNGYKLTQVGCPGTSFSLFEVRAEK